MTTPSRTELIAIIANEYGVSMETAEAWLTAMFSQERP